MAGLGRRTFAPGEVLTASNVMNYLQDQAVMNFAGTAARGSAIGTAVSEGMVSYLADSNAVEVYDGSAWKQVYPAVDVPTVGQIVQVVEGTKNDTATITSTSFADSGLSATITPKATSNQVLVMISIALGASDTAFVPSITITDSSNNILISPDSPGSRVAAFHGNYPNSVSYMTMVNFNFLHSPNTTSAFTYKVRMKSSGGTLYVNRSGTDSNTSAWMRGVSRITLMEVVA
jgi:hypothetical protein